MEVLLAIAVGLAIFGTLSLIIWKVPNAVLGFGVICIIIGTIVLAWFLGGLVLDAIFNTDIVHLKGE